LPPAPVPSSIINVPPITLSDAPLAVLKLKTSLEWRSVTV
jgi:hypothetical protein